MAIKKCHELGCVELIEGWWEDLVDKSGNARKIYHPDARKAYINSIKSLMSITECDFDEIAKTNIDKLLSDLSTRKEYWIDEEWRWWGTLSFLQRQQMSKEGKQVIKGFFNKKLDFDNHYYEEETEIYRKIFTEINNLTSRLDFYGNVDYEA
jgi:hypothetical protein